MRKDLTDVFIWLLGIFITGFLLYGTGYKGGVGSLIFFAGIGGLITGFLASDSKSAIGMAVSSGFFGSLLGLFLPFIAALPEDSTYIVPLILAAFPYLLIMGVIGAICALICGVIGSYIRIKLFPSPAQLKEQEIKRRMHEAVRLIDETPTSLIAEVKENQFVKIKGDVTCDQPLVTPEGKVKAVYYSYSKYKGSGSKRELIDSSSDSLSFYLQDATGKILVEPNNSQFEALIVYDKVHTTPEGLTFAVIERGIKVGEPAVVLGRVQRKRGKMVMCKYPEEPFIVSNKIM